MRTAKTMNHAGYQKRMRAVSVEALDYIIEDAGEAIKAQPFGINAGYYADEQHYAFAELKRREARA